MNDLVERAKARVEEGLKDEYCPIPEYMHGGIKSWIYDGIEPGSFLSAVICNDLKGAVQCADSTNALLIINYVKFFVWFAPNMCWGSPEKAQKWRGLNFILKCEDEAVG